MGVETGCCLTAYCNMLFRICLLIRTHPHLPKLFIFPLWMLFCFCFTLFCIMGGGLVVFFGNFLDFSRFKQDWLSLYHSMVHFGYKEDEGNGTTLRNHGRVGKRALLLRLKWRVPRMERNEVKRCVWKIEMTTRCVLMDVFNFGSLSLSSDQLYRHGLRKKTVFGMAISYFPSLSTWATDDDIKCSRLKEADALFIKNGWLVQLCREVVVIFINACGRMSFAFCFSFHQPVDIANGGISILFLLERSLFIRCGA
jgi:hypothetical protein